MNIQITTKNLDLTPAFKTFIEEKIGGLDRYLKKHKTIEAHVEVSKPSRHHRSGPIYYAEVNLTIDGQLIRAEAKNYEMRAAITDVKDELKVLIGKFKDKVSKR